MIGQEQSMEMSKKKFQKTLTTAFLDTNLLHDVVIGKCYTSATPPQLTDI